MTCFIVPPPTFLLLILAANVEAGTLLLLLVVLRLQRDRIDIVWCDDCAIFTLNSRLAAEDPTATLVYLLDHEVSRCWGLLLLEMMMKLMMCMGKLLLVSIGVSRCDGLLLLLARVGEELVAHVCRGV